MDADMEKSRFGTRVEPTVVYAQVGDLYQGELLREIVEEVGVSSPF
jgi:3-hydroxy-3-methylglutaryl CoA synthase